MSYTSFKKMKAELDAKPGVTNPGALTASIARKKYGNRAVEHAASSGSSLRRHKMLEGFAKRHG